MSVLEQNLWSDETAKKLKRFLVDLAFGGAILANAAGIVGLVCLCYKLSTSLAAQFGLLLLVGG